MLAQVFLCLGILHTVVSPRELYLAEQLIGSRHNNEPILYFLFKLLSGKHIALHQIIIQLLFRGISHQCVATTDIEVNIRQRVKPHIVGTLVHFYHSHHLQEQAQFGNLRSFDHYVHAIEITQDDALVDKVLDVAAILAGYLSQLLLEQVVVRGIPLLHPHNAHLIERFEYAHCRKQERS